MNTETLRAQHRIIIAQASELGGLAARIKTRDDAIEAEAVLKAIDSLLVRHLTIEDDWLYPVLMATEDADTRAFAADCFEEMGGILGAWTAYRDIWNSDAIITEPQRFALATKGIIGALAMRVEREDDDLYPAMDRILQASANIAQ